LLGRATELRVVESALYHPDDGAPPVGAVVLSGGPGVGKTRLLRAVAEQARAAGRTVELVAATRAAASIPFGALSHLVSAELAERPRGAAEPTAEPTAEPAVGHTAEHITGHTIGYAAEHTVLHTAATRLAAGRPREQVLVAADDAHLLDDASAAFLHHLAVHRLATVVVTIRGRESAPDAIVALWKDELAARVELTPLPDDTIDDLIDHALGGGVAGAARAKLRRLAEGNPLYLRELLLSGVESGTLRQSDALWQWYEPLREAYRLGELVEARLNGAGPETRAVLELLACGEPLPLAALTDDTGLAVAERAGLVEVIADGRRPLVRLAHPIYGEVLRAGFGPIRVREVHRTLVRWLSRQPLRRCDDLLRLAAWQLEAGVAADVSILLPAARQAAARYDLVLAERLARRAAGTGDPEAVRLLADVLHWHGSPGESASLLAAGPPRGLAAKDRARWLMTQAMTLYWGARRHAEARRAVEAARLAAPPADAGVEALGALMAFFDGRMAEAVELAIPVCVAVGAPLEARLWAYTAAVGAGAVLGRTKEALRRAAEAVDLAERHPGGPLISLPHLLIAQGHALALGGRLAEASAVAEAGYREALATPGGLGLTGIWAGLRGFVAQTRGDLPLAIESLREAAALAERQDPTNLRRVHLSVLAGALAMTGDPAAGGELRRADEAAGSPPGLYAAQIEVNRAWVVALDDPPGAQAVARRAAAFARTAGQPSVEAFALHDVARLGAPHRVYRRLGELATEVDSDLVAGYAESAAALAAADGPRLERVAAAFEGLDAILLAAEAMAAAVRAHRSAGNDARARRSQERARELALRAPAARTMPLSIDAPADALTSRERDVAVLAAQPMSSHDIARRLHLSTRTVDNHLGRIYAKLGIGGRGELADLLHAAERT
jgi:DNA-binding CsgD family transcriptional regulator